MYKKIKNISYSDKLCENCHERKANIIAIGELKHDNIIYLCKKCAEEIINSSSRITNIKKLSELKLDNININIDKNYYKNN